MRETRACLAWITHWTFEQIGDMQYPDILQMLDTHVTMKGGKKRRGPQQNDFPPSPNGSGRPYSLNPQAHQQFSSPQEQHEFDLAMAREGKAALREAKHISTQPLWVQQSRQLALMHDPKDPKSWDALFPKK